MTVIRLGTAYQSTPSQLLQLALIVRSIFYITLMDALCLLTSRAAADFCATYLSLLSAFYKRMQRL
jgi:hypothetical protein